MLSIKLFESSRSLLPVSVVFTFIGSVSFSFSSTIISLFQQSPSIRSKNNLASMTDILKNLRFVFTRSLYFSNKRCNAFSFSLGLFTFLANSITYGVGGPHVPQ
jgi:ABC-type transport system involved in cytochrome c biogenesis permease subunit